MLKPGLTATLSLPQFPDKQFRAKFETTANAFDAQTRTVVTELTVDNANHAIRHLKEQRSMRELEKARFGRLFATPFLEHLWSDGPELNVHLRESILEHARRHPGEQLTNIGGWHSDTGTLALCGSAGQRLLRHMHEMTEEATRRLYAQFARPPERLGWTLSAWANVNRPGDFNNMHTHPGATWSGVYYVDHGESDAQAEGTALHLSDPSPLRGNLFFPELLSADFQVKPVPGLMVLFPSYMPHAVPPHRGDRPRISIAFNVRKEPFP